MTKNTPRSFKREFDKILLNEENDKIKKLTGEFEESEFSKKGPDQKNQEEGLGQKDSSKGDKLQEPEKTDNGVIPSEVKGRFPSIMDLVIGLIGSIVSGIGYLANKAVVIGGDIMERSFSSGNKNADKESVNEESVNIVTDKDDSPKNTNPNPDTQKTNKDPKESPEKEENKEDEEIKKIVEGYSESDNLGGFKKFLEEKQKSCEKGEDVYKLIDKFNAAIDEKLKSKDKDIDHNIDENEPLVATIDEDPRNGLLNKTNKNLSRTENKDSKAQNSITSPGNEQPKVTEADNDKPGDKKSNDTAENKEQVSGPIPRGDKNEIDVEIPDNVKEQAREVVADFMKKGIGAAVDHRVNDVRKSSTLKNEQQIPQTR